MPNLLASVAPGDMVVRVRVVENGHFNGSPSTGWEWDYGPDKPRCFDKWGLGRGEGVWGLG